MVESTIDLGLLYISVTKVECDLFKSVVLGVTFAVTIKVVHELVN